MTISREELQKFLDVMEDDNLEFKETKQSYPFDQDSETVAGESIAYVAHILFGTHKALGQHLAQAKVVFEYRSSSISIPDCSTFERNERRGF